MSDPCLTDADLSAFASDSLDEARFEAMAAHLETCEACARRLPEPEDPALPDLGSVASGTTAIPDDLLEVARGASRSSQAGRLHEALEDGPQRMGDFEVLEPLGEGEFGVVFKARDLQLDRFVALKIQRGPVRPDGPETARFRREARAAAQIDHPHIVSTYDVGTTPDGELYIVSEFVDGCTLEHSLQGGAVDLHMAVEWIITMARALHAAHERGVIHRDLKPSNILIDSEGQPHIADFGLAKREEADGTVTSAGEIMGTPAYMSPEQARGDSHEVDARTDVYSLGVILYELVTGERPFQGNRRMLLLQVLEEEPRSPRRLVPALSRDLETIVLHAMAKSPTERYGSAGELASDLERFRAGHPIQARPVGWPGKLARWSRRHPIPAAVLALTYLALLGGLLGIIHVTESTVQDSALLSAEQQSVMLDEVNGFFSELLEGLDDEVLITHEYAARKNALPLPATFTIETGRRIGNREKGMEVRLYSDYPFPWRTNGGPRDAFEERALVALRARPAEPYHEFTEHQGRPSLRYATARLLAASCVGCHNTHPLSPKRDWQVGDLRGVLEIIRPLERDVKRARQRLTGAYLVMGGFALLLLVLTVVVLVSEQGRR